MATPSAVVICNPTVFKENCGSYGVKVWYLGGVTLWVTGGKCGSGNCWLGRYTLYYIYVGDINILYKFIVQNLPRGRDVPWRISTLGIYIILYIMANILLSIAKILLENQRYISNVPTYICYRRKIYMLRRLRYISYGDSRYFTPIYNM